MSGAFSRDFAEKKKWKTDEGLVRVLQYLCDEKLLTERHRMVDIGAGIGKYVQWFRDRDCDAQGFDAIEGIEDSGRGDEVILYTGNDNFIIEDLTEGYLISTANGTKLRRMAGGLLGHWAVWTKAAVETLELIKQARVTEKFDYADFL